ncbi:hypothetical protein E3U55_06370 [Filobacillus milosensis]|uniref:SHOCT domain-containing protein n=1 Tax=Filobacillus milosensis TaxID=94137 RepID=A0A4Y8INE7_9BACI|nr:SHOCT domain-containing protein [Filobacillus milosensis]TFB22859.1 hypothetical protein E3U55_06370 [Filobacillus milosensis]
MNNHFLNNSRGYRVKPGKSQSMLGMIVGVAFVFIGITQISNFGAFGIIWTLIAVAITGYHAVNVFSNKGVATYEVDVQGESKSPTQQQTGSEDYESKLRQLHRLKEDNIISEEEYNEKKEELLSAKW